MRTKMRFITTALSVGAAATAIVAAPAAMADSVPAQQSCVYLGASQTQCQTPGNVQINDSPTSVDTTPQYYYWGDGMVRGHR